MLQYATNVHLLSIVATKDDQQGLVEDHGVTWRFRGNPIWFSLGFLLFKNSKRKLQSIRKRRCVVFFSR
jgi:hypothetical protein